MRITFNTYRPVQVVQFKGLDDSLNKIKSKILNGTGFEDKFTPVQDGGTVIIENYYDNGDNQPKSKFRTGAATEGAVTGTATGSTIEGSKSAIKKIRENHNADDIDTDVDTESLDINPEDVELDPIDNDVDIDIDPTDITDIDPTDLIDATDVL